MPALLVHAWRSWKSAPGIALLAILAFAIGIGSTTAIFTVVNGISADLRTWIQGAAQYDDLTFVVMKVN